jgi:hypothetical protein
MILRSASHDVRKTAPLRNGFAKLGGSHAAYSKSLPPVKQKNFFCACRDPMCSTLSAFHKKIQEEISRGLFDADRLLAVIREFAPQKNQTGG